MGIGKCSEKNGALCNGGGKGRGGASARGFVLRPESEVNRKEKIYFQFNTDLELILRDY